MLKRSTNVNTFSTTALDACFRNKRNSVLKVWTPCVRAIHSISAASAYEHHDKSGLCSAAQRLKRIYTHSVVCIHIQSSLISARLLQRKA